MWQQVPGYLALDAVGNRWNRPSARSYPCSAYSQPECFETDDNVSESLTVRLRAITKGKRRLTLEASSCVGSLCTRKPLRGLQRDNLRKYYFLMTRSLNCVQVSDIHLHIAYRVVSGEGISWRCDWHCEDYVRYCSHCTKVNWTSSRSLSFSSGSSFTINPDYGSTYNLGGSYEFVKFKADVDQVTSISTNLTYLNTPTKLLSQIKDENLGHGDKPDYFNVQATVLFFKKDNALYKACPLEHQNFKVVDIGNGQYGCEKLYRTFDSFKWRYCLQVNIYDCTGEQWITLFNEPVERLLGYSAQALAELKESINVLYFLLFSLT
ncbi:replication protein A 70 kDa DNA-binding subunit-like [Corticium candelabrum]|uniref:replication protein A 70 kDa DNA-binding subunit-like n=1 Tax=Corticium candelabrum TaxID=121492 RepID=UPI002E258304|nr:replication protein A 70 kDa DNA-binding subunit-like [Corticium candelabrum]